MAKNNSTTEWQTYVKTAIKILEDLIKQYTNKEAIYYSFLLILKEYCHNKVNIVKFQTTKLASQEIFQFDEIACKAATIRKQQASLNY